MKYNEQEILDNKSPEGATEVDSMGVYYKYDPELICDHYVWMNEDSYNPKIEDRWRLMPDGNIEGATLIRSIADIKRIAELENELSEAIEIIEHSGVDYDEVLEAIRGDV
jgi:hypothetical protein